MWIGNICFFYCHCVNQALINLCSSHERGRTYPICTSVLKATHSIFDRLLQIFASLMNGLTAWSTMVSLKMIFTPRQECHFVIIYSTHYGKLIGTKCVFVRQTRQPMVMRGNKANIIFCSCFLQVISFVQDCRCYLCVSRRK